MLDIEIQYTEQMSRKSMAHEARRSGNSEREMPGRVQCVNQATQTLYGLGELRVKPLAASPSRSRHWCGRRALRGFDSLAYLLGMALKESRRLSQGQNGS